MRVTPIGNERVKAVAGSMLNDVGKPAVGRPSVPVVVGVIVTTSGVVPPTYGRPGSAGADPEGAAVPEGAAEIGPEAEPEPKEAAEPVGAPGNSTRSVPRDSPAVGRSVTVRVVLPG